MDGRGDRRGGVVGFGRNVLPALRTENGFGSGMLPVSGILDRCGGRGCVGVDRCTGRQGQNECGAEEIEGFYGSSFCEVIVFTCACDVVFGKYNNKKW